MKTRIINTIVLLLICSACGPSEKERAEQKAVLELKDKAREDSINRLTQISIDRQKEIRDSLAEDSVLRSIGAIESGSK
ncbi:MAG TPA: hypothetical protein VNX68_06770 [Nitrosopumilaceae archaeon]|jgi:hypothetical protein|nr:hypothetical protein [Nitrosopumilaceae archaeon]